MKFDPKWSVLAAVVASACATVSPQATQHVEQARATFKTAAADPVVQAGALVELKSAEQALQEAERLAEEAGPIELVQHNAYLVEQRSRIAMRTADIRRAEESLVAAVEERRRIQQEVREKAAR